jgi:hypothetical protein
VTDETNGPWFTSLPSCETEVPCGAGRHTVRWEAGSLLLPSHPDVEGELVLAALGGEKARCIELAGAWGRHTDDLSVLAIGPRGPTDEIAVGWDDVIAAAQASPGPRSANVPGLGGRPRPGALASRPGPTMARVAARRRRVQEAALAAQRRRNDILSLLALGHGFQVRLIGQVAATHAAHGGSAGHGGTTPLAPPEDAGHGGTTPLAPPEDAGHEGTTPLAPPEDAGHEGTTPLAPPEEQIRPALVAAIAGRLAPVAEEWLGIEPDQVVASLHRTPGWGSTELTGYGAARRLRVSLPAGWLASVWACGLARVGRYLVVAVDRPGWPQARVLGLRAPGAEPEPLDVHADPSGPGDVPHWEI